MRYWLTGLGVVVVVAAIVWFASAGVEKRGRTPSASKSPRAEPANPRPSGREDFVGSEACAHCHKAQADAYRDSHHAKALVPASTEPARFANGRFTSKAGGTTTFGVHDAKPTVTSPTTSESAARLPITHVAGVWPLEQYVVATERGKLQALGVAWDSRTQAQGGQRWFHVYGEDGIAPGDPLFFTSAAQNWNHMCAECHSTWVERGYDAQSDSFDTRWAELSVGCEACHGPGAEHVRTANAAAKGSAIAPLPARFSPRAPWTPSGTGSPLPRARDGVEVEVCAPCHSRREPLKEPFVAGEPLLDSFEPELLWAGRYHADGQVEGEVFEWGSFIQSRMYAAGVRCSDCHEPHSGELRAQGNALCTSCHEPARFDVPAHSHHAAGKAPLCIDCHMPPSTFMQIDERRDHSIRVPRPDHSALFGTPNACNGCHSEQSADWAQAQLARWFPASPARPHFVEALGVDRRGALDAPRKLRDVARDSGAASIARATALERLSQYPGATTVRALRAALMDRDALVVYGAVLGAAQLPLPQRAELLLPALEHPVRAVRIAAARSLAAVPVAEVPERARPALERAFGEVLESFAVNASRAETHVERSAFELARGKLAEAEAALQVALRLQPCLAEAQLNLAELARHRGDEAGAERAIRAALECHPESAAAHHALGLWQVRARLPKDAISSLRKAFELAAGNTRFGYVLAVALHGGGERDEAIRVLEQVLVARPNDASTLQTLVAYLSERGLTERAAVAREKLATLLRE